MDNASASTPSAQPRRSTTPARLPTQQRSRERVERMLAAASALIAEGGSDAMRMSEVAERAGVPIGSLYQFFPDKGAIVRTLAERYNALGRACIEEGLARCRRPRWPARCIRPADRHLLRAVPGRAGDARHLVGHAGRQGAARHRSRRQPADRRDARRRAGAAEPRRRSRGDRHQGVPDHESRRSDDAPGDLGRTQGRRRAGRRLQADGAAGSFQHPAEAAQIAIRPATAFFGTARRDCPTARSWRPGAS